MREIADAILLTGGFEANTIIVVKHQLDVPQIVRLWSLATFISDDLRRVAPVNPAGVLRAEWSGY
jgi:hypothetical protein